MSFALRAYREESSMSSIRELNDAKVANILTYLEHSCTNDKNDNSLEELTNNYTDNSNMHDKNTIHTSHLLDNHPSIHVTGIKNNNSELRASIGNTEIENKSQEHSFPLRYKSLNTADNNTKELSTLSLNLETVSNGLLEVHSTYSAIKNKIETLETDNVVLREKNKELMLELEQWEAEEIERELKMKRRCTIEMEKLQEEVARKNQKVLEELKSINREKQRLEEMVNKLRQQLCELESAHKQEIQKIELANTSAIVQLKTRWQAQEKVAREKWKLAEAKRIKESTLQSLEPDIVLLLNRHKAEKARLREEYEIELKRRDEIAEQKQIAVEELKKKIQNEAEVIRVNEQTSFETRLRDQIELLRREREEERRNQLTKQTQIEEFYENQQNLLKLELKKVNQELLQVKSELNTLEVSFQETVSREVTRITSESNDVIKKLKLKLEAELSLREEATELEIMKRVKERETALIKQFEHDRDAAIEKAIEELANKHKEALNSSRHNDGILRDRCQQLNRDNERLRVEVELTREQLEEARNALREKEKRLDEFKTKCNSVDEVAKAAVKETNVEWQRKIRVLEVDWQQKISDKEQKHALEKGELQQRLDFTLNELELIRKQIETLQQTSEQRHHAELDQINERVLIAMTQKDNTIRAQSEQIITLREAIKVRDRELAKHHNLIQEKIKELFD